MPGVALKHFPRISDEFLVLYNSLKKRKEHVYFGLWTRTLVQKHESILYSFLSREEKARYQEFRLTKRKEEFLAGRILLKLGLLNLFQSKDWQESSTYPNAKKQYSKLRFQDLHIKKTPQGKPELMIQNEKNSQIHLSISHSNSVIFTAIDPKNEIGIDVENLHSDRFFKIKPKYLEKTEEELLEKFLQKQRESSLFSSYAPSLQKGDYPISKKEELGIFYSMFWCSKESLIKLLGISRTEMKQRLELSHIQTHKRKNQNKNPENRGEFDAKNLRTRTFSSSTLAAEQTFHSIFYWKHTYRKEKKIADQKEKDFLYSCTLYSCTREKHEIMENCEAQKKNKKNNLKMQEWVISKNYPYQYSHDSLMFSISQKGFCI